MNTLFSTGNKTDKKADNKKTTDNWNGDGTSVEVPKSHQELVDAAKKGGPLKDGETTEVKITLWSNGF